MISSIRLLFGSISLLALAGCAGPQSLAPLANAHAAAGESIAATVTFRVTVPTATPVGDTVFIAGSLQAWNPGSAPHALTRQSDGRRIIGTVGQLQFEVIQHRLESEYNAKCRYEPVSLHKACWVHSDDPKAMQEFLEKR